MVHAKTKAMNRPFLVHDDRSSMKSINKIDGVSGGVSDGVVSLIRSNAKLTRSHNNVRWNDRMISSLIHNLVYEIKPPY
jgi:hypothetical protein